MNKISRRRLGELAGGTAMTGALATACRAEPDPVPSGLAFSQFKHVVVLMFENRSFDNMLGWLYEPGQVPRGQAFEGVAGKTLSNPIPPYADQAARGSVPVGKGTVMDNPNPDPGEEYPHINTQLYGTVRPEGNRFAQVSDMVAPFNAPAVLPATSPMNGFVTDYVAVFKLENGRDPTYDEYRIIMDCFPPEAVPVISTLAREFAVFDHWFCSAPTMTFPNRSFFHTGSSPLVLNTPYAGWVRGNSAETIFDRIDAVKQRGLSWRVYYDTANVVPLTAFIHLPRLGNRLGTNFVTMPNFYRDARRGTLPAYSFIEPRFFFNHNDAHPPYAELGKNPWPSSVLAAEQLLNDVYKAVRASNSVNGSNWQNTLLLVTFDEHGGCYDHVPPPVATRPGTERDRSGQMDFVFDRAGPRVPTIAISAYTEPGTVINMPFEHTAVLRTLSSQWELGHLTERDRSAPDLAPVFNRRTPRPRETWPAITPRPYDARSGDDVGAGLNALQRAITGLGSAILDEVGAVERDVQGVRDAAALLRRVRARLR